MQKENKDNKVNLADLKKGQIQELKKGFKKAFPDVLTSLNLSNNNNFKRDKIQAIRDIFSSETTLNLYDDKLVIYTEKEMINIILSCPNIRKITFKKNKFLKKAEDLLINRLFDSNNDLTILEIDIIDKTLANKIERTSFHPGEETNPGNLPNIINEMRGEGRYENSSTFRVLSKFPDYITSLINKFRQPVLAVNKEDKIISSFPMPLKAEEVKAILGIQLQHQYPKADAYAEKAAEADQTLVTSSNPS